MRFPLAFFCWALCLTMLAAAQLPAAVLYVAVGSLAAVLILVQLGVLRRLSLRALPIVLVLAAMVMALGARVLYNRTVLAPVAALDGTVATVRARVFGTEPGFGEDTVHATIEVLEIDGEWLKNSFTVKAQGLPLVEPGQLVEVPLRFYNFSTSAARNSAYAKGRGISAALSGEAVVVGVFHNSVTRLRVLQYAASENIRARLPLRLGSAAAAMSVGDKRFLPYEVSAQYRAAGFSHLLVVSGLHLSLLAGAAHQQLQRWLSRRRTAAIGMGLVVFFMVFTGLAPSIVRSGFMWLMIFFGDMLGRKAHAPTSLGIAVALMALQNPYALLDVGLQLSVTATLGMIFSSRVQAAAKKRFDADSSRWRLAKRLGMAAIPSAGATLFTLPVVIGAQLGVSLLGVPMNLIAIPLMPALVLSGFAMALPLGVPVLNWIAATGALIGGTLLRLLELLGEFCEGMPSAFVPVGGGFALVIVVVVYALVAVGIKLHRTKLALVLAGVMLAAGFGFNAILSYGTVRVVVAGGATPSLVVIQGRQAAVLYRSRTSSRAVADVLWRYQVQECTLLVDLRQTSQSTEYEDLFSPAQVVVANEDFLTGGVYNPFDGTEITVLRQSKGTFACLDVQGYRVGCYTGAVNLFEYPPVDILLAGRGKAQGKWGGLLAMGDAADWNKETEVLKIDGQTCLWLRPGKSVIIREVVDGDGI